MTYDLSIMYKLTYESIDKNVKQKPGVYVLDKNRSGSFQINFVGRANADLNDRLKQHIAEGYKFFEFEYATSPKEAFEKECELYHDKGGPEGKLDNKIHPDRPKNTDWKCPKCNIFNQ